MASCCRLPPFTVSNTSTFSLKPNLIKLGIHETRYSTSSTGAVSVANPSIERNQFFGNFHFLPYEGINFNVVSGIKRRIFAASSSIKNKLAENSEDKPKTPVVKSNQNLSLLKKVEELRKENEILQSRLSTMEKKLETTMKLNDGKVKDKKIKPPVKKEATAAETATAAPATAAAATTTTETGTEKATVAPAAAAKAAKATVATVAPAVAVETATAGATEIAAAAAVEEEKEEEEEEEAVVKEEEKKTVKSFKKSIPKIENIEWPSPADDPPFWKRLSKLSSTGAESAEALSRGSQIRVLNRDPKPIHVVHITAEMAPLAKVGGLGDVVTGLARACIARGHTVQVFLPFYSCIDSSAISNLSLLQTYGSYYKGEWPAVEAYQGTIEGIPVILLKPQNNFFRGDRIYGGSYNELEAYLFFSRASLEYLQVTKSNPDIIHIHEWHTAAVSLLYWDMYNSLSLNNPRIVLTIHNMEHHGECRQEQFDIIGLNGESYATGDKAVDDRTIGHNPERLSLLKGGIVYSNAVTTVSPTYVQETLCGGWLSAALLKYREKYYGLLNGIDTEIWDPSTDPFLPFPYDDNDLTGKQICKLYLQRGLGLGNEMKVETLNEAESQTSRLVRSEPDRSLPLVVCITRLVPQKGIHLIRRAIFRTRELGGQFVLLGSSPDGRCQSEFESLAKEFEGSDDIRLILAYSEDFSHLLYAAADVILVPSMFEPCGLTQMIGMRYGTIPVVRKTGGLADTVFDVDDSSNSKRSNGFVFEGIHEGALDGALDRALTYYREKPNEWNELSKKVMKIDNSWIKSAGEYIQLYNSVRAR